MSSRIKLWVSLLCALLALPAWAVDGTDLPGHDYANFEAPSALVCRTSCGGESRCQAYTWVKPGVQGAAARCYLKDAEPSIVRNACCDSAPRRFITQRDLKAEDHIDRPGSDYKHFDGNNWQDCEATCKQESACASWSWVRPGVQAASGRCWLKNHVAHPVANNDVISGVKYRSASVRID